MLKKINYFTDTTINSNITDIIEYGNISLNKPTIKLTLVVEDDYGNDDIQDYEVKIYNISNIVFTNDNKVNFDIVTLTTNNNLKIRLEIIDKNNIIYGISEFITLENSKASLSIDYSDFDIRTSDELFYRFLVKDETKNLTDYFPSRSGDNSVSSFSNIENIKSQLLKSAIKPIGLKNELDIDSDIINKFKLSDANYVEQMLNIYSNPHESYTEDLLNDRYKDYIKKSPFNNYAMNIEGINGNILEFNIPEIDHVTFERFKFRIFNKGKKLLEDSYRSQNNYDGLAKVWLSDIDINNEANLEIQSIKNLLNNTERFNYTIEIDSLEKINKLHNEGLIINEFYYEPSLLTCHIIRPFKSTGECRINLNRFKISKVNNESLRIKILDILYSENDIQLGDKLYITSDIIYEREVLTSNPTVVKNSDVSYIRPTYFIPFSFITINDNIVTDISSYLDQIEIFINGLCAIPNDDYVILPPNNNLGLTSVILFKDLLFSSTKVEIIFRGTDKENSNIHIISNNVTTLKYSIPSDSLPLVGGCYDVYSNNRKIPDTMIKTINKNTFAIVKDTNISYTNINPNDIYIKYNYPNNRIVNTLLNAYKNLSVSDKSISEYTVLTNANVQQTEGLTFAKYIWDIEETNTTLKLKSIYELLGNDNYVNILNSNETSSISNGDLIPNKEILPILYNHDINIFPFVEWSKNHFEYNITYINPSRILQITDSLNKIDCNNNSMQYDIFLNEDIDINLDYIKNNIVIDCNSVFK